MSALASSTSADDTLLDGPRSSTAGPPRRAILTVRLLFGVAWAIDAVLKWLPGYRHSFLSQLQGAAQGQPSWLHPWSVGEGFGGPYTSGATDIGAGIIYALFFAAMLTFAPAADREPFSLDRVLIYRFTWWKHLAEPHADNRR